MPDFVLFMVLPFAAPLAVATAKSVRLALGVITAEIALVVALLVADLVDPYRLSALLVSVIGAATLVVMVGLHKLAKRGQERSSSRLLTLLAGKRDG